MSVCVFLVKEGYHPLKAETVGLIIAAWIKAWQQGFTIAISLKMASAQYVECSGCPELAKTEYIQLGLIDVTVASRRFYC